MGYNAKTFLWNEFACHTDGNGIEDTSPTYKALEEGSASQSKEEIAQMANRQQKFIQGLEAALVRVEMYLLCHCHLYYAAAPSSN